MDNADLIFFWTFHAIFGVAILPSIFAVYDMRRTAKEQNDRFAECAITLILILLVLFKIAYWVVAPQYMLQK